MTQRDAVSVAAKVLGLYMLARAIVAVPGVFEAALLLVRGSIREPIATGLIGAGIAGEILSFGIALVLLACSTAIAGRIGGADSEVAITRLPGAEQSIFRVALRVIGVVVVCTAVPELLSALAQNGLAFCHFGGKGFHVGALSIASSLWRTQWAAIVKAGMSLAIAAYLIWGAAQFTRMVYRTRPSQPEEGMEPGDE